MEAISMSSSPAHPVADADGETRRRGRHRHPATAI
jgi:hypothetical protein